MILSDDVYNEIVVKFQNHKGTFRELKNAIVADYGIPDLIASGLLSNEYKFWIKKNYYKMNMQGNKLFQRYLHSRDMKKDSSLIMKMAEEMKTSPALLSKMIAEKYFSHVCLSGNSSKNGKQKHFMKDTSLLEDQDIAYELFMCVLYDEQYGPLTDAINLSFGQEYELHLQKIIKEKNIPFQCEDDLRVRGYDKTPDIKLNIPIAVEGFIVNWIESKALFASPKVHKGYIEKQYSSYWNRFGTGLVIYWLGVVDSVIDPKEKRFIVRCQFPENVTTINPFSIASIPKGLALNEMCEREPPEESE